MQQFFNNPIQIYGIRDIRFAGAQHHHVEVTVGHLRASGISKDKKVAKQEAARMLLKKFDEGDPRIKFASAFQPPKRTPVVNNQKKADQMKARFFREVEPNVTDRNEEQEDKCPSKSKKEGKSSIAGVSVILSDLVATRSLKNKYERPGRVRDQMKAQMKIKSQREGVGAAEASASEANNNWPMPGRKLVDANENDEVKLVDRVKWRLARMEERLSRGEGANGGLARRIEDVKEKLWRFKYLTWLKNRQMRPTRSGESFSPVPPNRLSTWPSSGSAEADNFVQMTLQTSGYGLAESLEKAVENETGVLIQRKEIKSGRICVVLSGREEDVLKARALLKRNCQPQVEISGEHL